MNLYYYIINENRNPNIPTVKHPNQARALEEAKRLAKKHPGNRFAVLAAIATVQVEIPEPVVTFVTF